LRIVVTLLFVVTALREKVRRDRGQGTTVAEAIGIVMTGVDVSGTWPLGGWPFSWAEGCARTWGRWVCTPAASGTTGDECPGASGGGGAGADGCRAAGGRRARTGGGTWSAG
jgi:hypothetical protein